MAALGLALGPGCLTGGRETQDEAVQRIAAERARSAQVFKESIVARRRQLSIPELDQLTYGYADRYFMVISSAVDAIKRGNPDPDQRRRAHQIKLNGVLSMNDIVSGNDPYAQIFDLVVSVTLQSIVLIDEDGAEKSFGDRSPGLIQAIHTMRVEAWELAAKVMTQAQLELLDYLILEWRRTHPEIEQVAFVKFENFAGVRSAGLLTELRSGGGLLAPLSETNQVLKDWGRLSERVFWYSKRAPNIAAIQAEGAVNEILSTPEISTVLQSTERLARTAEAAPRIIDEQREAFFAELDERETLLADMLDDLRRVLADADALSLTVTQTLGILGDTLQMAERVGRTFGLDKPSAQPARPFDIQDYTAALTRLNEVVTSVHRLSLDVDQLSRSEAWSKALKDMTEATDRRVDRVFRLLCLAIGLAFALAILYRVVSIRLARRPARPAPDKP